MSRGIYEIKLKNRYFPALSEEDAVEMRNNGINDMEVPAEDVEVKLIVKEEHTLQLFLLAKTMYDMDRFDCKEIEAVVRALAQEMGYFTTYAEIADCVTTWVERVTDDMTITELEEWMIG